METHSEGTQSSQHRNLRFQMYVNDPAGRNNDFQLQFSSLCAQLAKRISCLFVAAPNTWLVFILMIFFQSAKKLKFI